MSRGYDQNGKHVNETKPNGEPSPNLQAALHLTSLGLRVLPLHHLLPPSNGNGGGCSCRKPDCPPKHRGKHPLYLNWQREATTNANQVRAWWGATPRANVGVATGARAE